MIHRFMDKNPLISKSAFIAGTASIIGDVSIGERSSVWFNSVIRGDRASISIGSGCCIQDNSVIHSDENDIIIGDNVIMGHGCIVHGNLISNHALIGMNATILHGATVGKYAIVGAGALVPPGHKIDDNSVVMGVPCKKVRKTSEEDIEMMMNKLKEYGKLTEEYIKMIG